MKERVKALSFQKLLKVLKMSIEIPKDLVRESSYFFIEDKIVGSEIYKKALEFANADGEVHCKPEHFVKAGLPVNMLSKIGYRPANLLNFQPRDYYDFWGISLLNVGFIYRYDFIKKNGFPIITSECLVKLVKTLKGRKVLDVGSGSCVLGEKLKSEGIDLTTIDCRDYTKLIEEDCGGYFFDSGISPDIVGKVEKIDISPYNAFLISWPDIQGSTSTSVLRRLKRGDMMIVVGEDVGGCTASNRFFKKIEDMVVKKKVFYDIEKSMYLSEEAYNFFGIHDRFFVYVRC